MLNGNNRDKLGRQKFPQNFRVLANSTETYVRDDREVGDALEDRVPDPDVLDPLSARPTALGEVLEGVQTDLDEVIDEGEEGSQREGGHEHRHETVLDHCHERKKKQNEFRNNFKV